jgi:hypothetical protein
MSFLKKHWRFTVPAGAVLCVLLLGVVVLYSTSEPPEPKTVYAMPERSADPPSLNNGGVTSMSINTEPRPKTIGVTELPTNAVVAEAESLESCCPEEELLPESASTDDGMGNLHIHAPTPEAMEDARTHIEFVRSLLEHDKEAQALTDEWLSLDDQEEQADKIVHNGETIAIFDEISVDESGHLNTGRLTRDEAIKYVKQAQAKYDEIARQKEAAWRKIQEWELYKPIEPTYTSTEYTADH